MPTTEDLVRRLARRQGGAVGRAQVLALGASEKWVRVRAARDWQRAQPGVYVTHTGPLTWRNTAWAALVYAGEGAVLGFDAAAHEQGWVRRPPRTVDVWIPSTRRVRDQPTVRVHRRIDLPDHRVLTDPPTTRREITALDLVTRCRDDDGLVDVVTRAVRAGTSPAAVLDVLATRPAQRWRSLLVDVLAEAEEGVESPLERHYHHDVERAHGLPRSVLQVRRKVGGWWIRVDRRCEPYRMRVELDGELAHPGGRTDDDTWRDNEAVIGDHEITLRYRWSHAVGATCETAAQVARAAIARGWAGRPRPCGPTCRVAHAMEDPGPPKGRKPPAPTSGGVSGRPRRSSRTATGRR